MLILKNYSRRIKKLAILEKPKLSRKEKVLKYLETAATKEVSNDDLIVKTGIDRSNMPKVLKPLEQKGLIHRRYEQIGRAKFVWVSLTNSQSNKETNSHTESTNSPSKIKSFVPNDIVQEIFDDELTNSQSNKETNSHTESTNSRVVLEFIVQEISDLATTVLNWIQGYRINVVRNPNGKQAILEMPRMLKLYKKLTGYEYIETKNDKFKEYLSKIKKMEENQS